METRAQALLGTRSTKRIEGKTRSRLAKAKALIEEVAVTWGEIDGVMAEENLMLFAKSLQSVASAQKTDADRALRIEQETRKTAAAQAEKAMKARGMTGETIDFIRNAVLGKAE